jgi:hypothetical protein
VEIDGPGWRANTCLADDYWAAPATASRPALSSGVTVDPPAALTALPDALEAELIAAPTVEVRFSLRLTGRARNAACDEVRSLLNEAKAATEEGSARVRPHDMRDEPVRFDLGLYRH